MFLLGMFAFPPKGKRKKLCQLFIRTFLDLMHWALLTRLTLPVGLFCSIFSFKGNVEFLLEVCLSLLVVQFIVGFMYFLCNFLAKNKVKMVNIRDSSSGLHIIVLAKRCQFEVVKKLFVFFFFC